MATKAGRLQDALAWLERIRAEVPLTLEPWWLSPWPPIRYARAELLFLLGRYDDAARWFLANQRFGGDEWIAPRMRRLGQIEERRGNKEKAVAYHSRFIELWKDCDPELRPQVEEAQARLAGLQGPSH
jgi:tetratricopeptide (TPR) repeat protein